jgi:deoxycytidylate deaminase
MPCPRCKRVLINAGIKEIVTIDESGNITKYDVQNWIKEDKDNYLKTVEMTKKNQL